MSRLETEKKIKLRYLILASGLMIWAWQYHEYSKSFDNCQNTLQEVKINLANLGQSISELEILINNQHRWEKAHD